MERAEEREMMRKAAAGDREAAAKCIRTFQPSVYTYILRMSGRPDVAEDIVQEAFVRVLTNLHRFDDRYRFSTWLFTIARRLYVNACQKMKPRYDTSIVDGWGAKPMPPEASIDDGDAMSHARSSLNRVLQELPATQREVIVLFHQLDWPIALIAEHLGMPEGTVKSHLHRGRKKLRDLLEASEKDIAQVEDVWA
ncbi:MAG: RNA polymerase sigma factor [Planctomycetota bacterium]